jgi:Flp pilus assembly pilin Flp
LQDDSGTALVEFALIVPLFALMLFAMIQFGIGFAGWDQLRNSVQFVARQAAMGALPACSTGPTGSAAACDAAMLNGIDENGKPVGTIGFPNVVFYYNPDDTSHEFVVCALATVQAFTGFPGIPKTYSSTSAFYVEPQAQLPASFPPNCGP